MNHMIALSLIAIANALGNTKRIDGTCPYQPGDGSSMFCTPARAVSGTPGDASLHCPELHTKRITAFNKFYASSYQDFMESAKNFKVAPLFDKSAALVGNETYEEMIMQHVKCMSVPEAAQIEDKIILKQTAESAGIPVTTWFYGAHESDFSRDALKEALVHKVCEAGVDAFIIKATHLAWSQGQKIVRDWQATCKEGPDDEIDSLADFIESGVLALRNHDPDTQHLAESLKPGVIVEELFKTGGLSRVPLEAKVMVVWGKLFDICMKGQDNRGCSIGAGNWDVYGDGTGWNLNGMINEKSDSASDFFMQNMFQKIKSYAEVFAGQHLKADLARIDFFINFDGDVKLNEVETVSGNWYIIEHQELGAIWRNGYLINGWIDADADDWSARLKHVAGLRHRAENPGLHERLGHAAMEYTRTEAKAMEKKKELEDSARKGLDQALQAGEDLVNSARRWVSARSLAEKTADEDAGGFNQGFIDADGTVAIETDPLRRLISI